MPQLPDQLSSPLRLHTRVAKSRKSASFTTIKAGDDGGLGDGIRVNSDDLCHQHRNAALRPLDQEVLVAFGDAVLLGVVGDGRREDGAVLEGAASEGVGREQVLMRRGHARGAPFKPSRYLTTFSTGSTSPNLASISNRFHSTAPAILSPMVSRGMIGTEAFSDGVLGCVADAGAGGRAGQNDGINIARAQQAGQHRAVECTGALS